MVAKSQTEQNQALTDDVIKLIKPFFRLTALHTEATTFKSVNLSALERESQIGNWKASIRNAR